MPQAFGGRAAQATFQLYGSFAHTYRGHGTDKALVASLLSMATDDTRIRDSFSIARDAGLGSLRARAGRGIQHPNTVDIEVPTKRARPRACAAKASAAARPWSAASTASMCA
ncbi:MAG: hypothetical protein ACLT98_14025 [Eggerthellaceae bacterium]